MAFTVYFEWYPYEKISRHMSCNDKSMVKLIIIIIIMIECAITCCWCENLCMPHIESVVYDTGFEYKDAIGKVMPCGSLRGDISSFCDGAIVDKFKEKKGQFGWDLVISA